MNLQGKRLLITGGAKRVGLAIAREMAGAGCRIILHARNMSDASRAVESLPGTGHRAIAGDLADPAAVENICHAAGTFEYLVNNAALFFRPGSAEDIGAKELYDQVNFKTPGMLLEYFFAQNISEGAAVNITDCFALLPGSGAYWQSKKDLTDLTVKLAPLWAERKFRINAVAPGPMLPPPWALESRMEKILQTVPLHRPVELGEVVEMVKFMLTAGSITGAVVPVDGGISARG